MKRLARTIAVLAFAFVAAACQRESAHHAPLVAASAPATSTTANPPSAKSTSNAFRVEVTLSPAAHERLVSQRESLIVSAEYFGYPSERAQAQQVPGSQNPWLTLHRANVELDGARLDDTPIARFPAVALDAKQLAWTSAPGTPQVNINVYSGRRSSPDNLLDCGMFQDTLAVTARAPIRLSCGLIGKSASR